MDSGTGFDYEAAKMSRGLGLVSMEERLKLVKVPGQSTRSPSVVPRSMLVCL